MNEYIAPEEYAKAKRNGIPKPTLERRVWSYHWPKERATTERVRTYGRNKRKVTKTELRKRMAIEELHALGVSADESESLEQLELRLALARVEEIDVESDSQKWF